MKAIGYLRVSTDSQADSGLSLEAQRAKIEAYANLYGYELVEVLEEAASGKSLQRAALQAGLAALTAGRPKADALIVAKLDRLTRSVRDLGALLDSAFRRCALVSVTEQVDTSTASGRMVLHILTSDQRTHRRRPRRQARPRRTLQRPAAHRLPPRRRPRGGRRGRDAHGGRTAPLPELGHEPALDRRPPLRGRLPHPLRRQDSLHPGGPGTGPEPRGGRRCLTLMLRRARCASIPLSIAASAAPRKAAGMSRARLGRALLAHGLRTLLPDGRRLDPDVLGHVVRDAAEYAARIAREETRERPRHEDCHQRMRERRRKRTGPAAAGRARAPTRYTKRRNGPPRNARGPRRHGARRIPGVPSTSLLPRSRYSAPQRRFHRAVGSESGGSAGFGRRGYGTARPFRNDTGATTTKRSSALNSVPRKPCHRQPGLPPPLQRWS